MRADLSASEHEGPNMEGAGKARRRGERGFVSVGWEWYVHIALSGLRARMGWGGAVVRVDFFAVCWFGERTKAQKRAN